VQGRLAGQIVHVVLGLHRLQFVLKSGNTHRYGVYVEQFQLAAMRVLPHVHAYWAAVVKSEEALHCQLQSAFSSVRAYESRRRGWPRTEFASGEADDWRELASNSV